MHRLGLGAGPPGSSPRVGLQVVYDKPRTRVIEPGDAHQHIDGRVETGPFIPRRRRQTTPERTGGAPPPSSAIIGREALLRLVEWCRQRQAIATPGGSPCSDALDPLRPPVPNVPPSIAEPPLDDPPGRAAAQGPSSPRPTRRATARTGARRQEGDR